MLWNYFKKTKSKIYTPVNGEIIPLEQVSDPVFSEKMMGEGIAIIPKSGNVYSPVEGTVIQVAPTKHAIGIQADEGLEILIHVGLDTVNLKGEGFSMSVNVNDRVSVGQQLMEVDWDYVRTHAKSIVTPIVVTNSNDCGKNFSFTEEKVGIPGKTVLMTATPN